MAVRIAEQRKTLRTLSEVWCPTCSRRLAAVVIVDGEPWLWIVGGRIGSKPGFLRAVDELLADAHDDAVRADGQGQAEVASHLRASMRRVGGIRDRLLQEAGAVEVAGSASRVPLSFRLEDYEALVPCRGCRREIRIGPARPLP